MRRALAFLGVAAIAALAPATAGAKPRYKTCVKESSGCKHNFEGGSIPTAIFRDHKHAHTHYRICARGPNGFGRQCLNRTTKGRNHADLLSFNNIGVGTYKVVWRVKGKVVGRWTFHYAQEGE
jgi:hypothetical protein